MLHEAPPQVPTIVPQQPTYACTSSFTHSFLPSFEKRQPRDRSSLSNHTCRHIIPTLIYTCSRGLQYSSGLHSSLHLEPCFILFPPPTAQNLRAPSTHRILYTLQLQDSSTSNYGIRSFPMSIQLRQITRPLESSVDCPLSSQPSSFHPPAVPLSDLILLT